MDAPDVSFSKGETYKDMGLFREAIAEFGKALADESLIYRTCREIASCFLALNLPDQAEKMLLKALCFGDIPKKNRLLIYGDLADIYLKLGRSEAALERLVLIQSEDPAVMPDLEERIRQLTKLIDFSIFDADSALGLTAMAPDAQIDQSAESEPAPVPLSAVGYMDPRRRAPRHKFSGRIEYSFDQARWATGYATDLSLVGMFVLTHAPVPVGSVVFLRFELPDGAETGTVDLIGQAVRQESKQKEKDNVLGMGIQFLSVDETIKAKLEQLLGQLESDEHHPLEQTSKIRFHCDHCGRIVTSTEASSGQMTKCPCGESVLVPFGHHEPAPDNPLRGYRVAGCRIDRIIGKGSVATVYKGHHLALDIPVAIKILNPNLKKSGSRLADRFVKEAQVIARINHANIVAVMNAGEEAGHSFIVMQYVAGRSLQDALNSKQEITTTDFLRIFLDVCKALQAAHEHSAVHGDIKPANILLTPAGSAMLVDFGLVKDLNTYQDDSERGMAMGTPLYMSPEQARGEHAVEVRSDIYSLGATMYHVLVGKPPFSAFTNLEVIRKHVTEQLIPPVQVLPSVPAALSDIIAKAMEKKPDDRFRTVEGLKQELLKLSRDVAIEQFKPLIKSARLKARKAAK
ncbi:MAG: protein kinase [Desulfomonile tiedjei]|nr:protein kinase [Desulfomonile tiedjei]